VDVARRASPTTVVRCSRPCADCGARGGRGQYDRLWLSRSLTTRQFLHALVSSRVSVVAAPISTSRPPSGRRCEMSARTACPRPKAASSTRAPRAQGSARCLS